VAFVLKEKHLHIQKKFIIYAMKEDKWSTTYFSWEPATSPSCAAR
jgi:hypothetical protein